MRAGREAGTELLKCWGTPLPHRGRATGRAPAAPAQTGRWQARCRVRPKVLPCCCPGVLLPWPDAPDCPCCCTPSLMRCSSPLSPRCPGGCTPSSLQCLHSGSKAQGIAEVLKHVSLMSHSTSSPCSTHRTTPFRELASRLACRPAQCCQQVLQAVCTETLAPLLDVVALSTLKK